MLSILYLLLASPMALASLDLCASSEVRDVHQLREAITACRIAAHAQHRPHLANWIIEQQERCEVNAEYLSHSFFPCMRRAVFFAREVVTCDANPMRFQQTMASEQALLPTSSIGRSIFTPSPNLLNAFRALTQAAERQYSFPFGRPNWRLEITQAPGFVAHSLPGGSVFISSDLVAGDHSLPEPELEAIIAQEIAHIALNHAHRLGCLALEMSGANLHLKDAIAILRGPGATSQMREREAFFSQHALIATDRSALLLLRASGKNPQAITQARALRLRRAN